MKKSKNYLKKPWIRKGSSKVKIIISKKEIETFNNYLRLEFEVCGIIIGEIQNSNSIKVRGIQLDKESLNNENLFGVIRKTKNIHDKLEDAIQDHPEWDWIGEWHTHPTGSCSPSSVDLLSMFSLLEDPDYGSPMKVVLIIAGKHCINGWVFSNQSGNLKLKKAKIV